MSSAAELVAAIRRAISECPEVTKDNEVQALDEEGYLYSLHVVEAEDGIIYVKLEDLDG